MMPVPTDILYSAWISILAFCTVITLYTDIKWYWIPYELIGIAAVVNIAAWAGNLVGPDWYMAGVISITFLIAAWMFPKGLGAGDGLLIAALCIGCQGQTAYVMVITAFAAAAVFALIHTVWAGKGVIPFGPFIWGGWWTAWGVGETVLAWIG